jgi:hypothetical protein
MILSLLLHCRIKSQNLVSISVKWVSPLSSWTKLNTDSASLGNPGLAGGGGVILDSSGSWIGGYSRAIGITTSVRFELKAF